MKDCPFCWENPCLCGWAYRDWKIEDVLELIEGILQKRNDREIILEILEKSGGETDE